MGWQKSGGRPRQNHDPGIQQEPCGKVSACDDVRRPGARAAVEHHPPRDHTSCAYNTGTTGNSRPITRPPFLGHPIVQRWACQDSRGRRAKKTPAVLPEMWHTLPAPTSVLQSRPRSAAHPHLWVLTPCGARSSPVERAAPHARDADRNVNKAVSCEYRQPARLRMEPGRGSPSLVAVGARTALPWQHAPAGPWSRPLLARSGASGDHACRRVWWKACAESRRLSSRGAEHPSETLTSTR